MKNLVEMKKEAIERMKMLKMLDNPIVEFDKEGKLNLSERGILFWLNKKEQNMVNEFERENDALVYHVIKSYTNSGLMYSLLYVSYSEEWSYDREDIKNESAVAYVINVDAPECSEFGKIGIRPCFGGVIRTA